MQQKNEARSFTSAQRHVSDKYKVITAGSEGFLFAF